MIYISERKHKIVCFIRDHPGTNLTTIRKMSGMKQGSVSNYVSELYQLGVIERLTTGKRFTYRFTGKPYTIGVSPKEKAEIDKPVPDLLLDELTTVKVTDEQLAFIRSNRKMPRRQLAQQLGMSKLELNQVMYKHGIKSKVSANLLDAIEND